MSFSDKDHRESFERQRSPLNLPVTMRDMQSLLQPLQNCLQRMEKTLSEVASETRSPLTGIPFDVPLIKETNSAERDLTDAAIARHATPTSNNTYNDTQASSPERDRAGGEVSDRMGMNVHQAEKQQVQVAPMFEESPAVIHRSPPGNGDGLCVTPSGDDSLSGTNPGMPLADCRSLPMEQVSSMAVANDGWSEFVHHPKSLKHHKTVLDIAVAEKSSIENLIERWRIDRVLSRITWGEKPIVEWFYLAVDRCHGYWMSLEEPERKGWLYGLTTCQPFETLCMLAITFNSGLVAYQADWQMKHIGDKDPKVLEIMELTCLVYFSIELLLRLATHRCFFFLNSEMHWNNFDFALVTISLLDFVFDKIGADITGGNVGFMRLLRLLKLARIFRSLRSFRFFRSLAVLLESFQKSFISLFWGLIMLAFVLYLFSLIFMQALIGYLTYEQGVDADMENKIMQYFGSLEKTIVSLYMSVTGGNDWAIYYEILNDTGATQGLAFCLFTFFFLFALFNILTGALVEKAMSSNKQDRTDQIMRQRKKFATQKREFIDICKSMDADGDGKISWEEFEEWIDNPVMLAYMAHLGIEVHDVELFFDTVAVRLGREGKLASHGEITIEHFVEGCMHMRGTATAIDMQRQLFEMHILHHELTNVENALVSRFAQLEGVILRASPLRLPQAPAQPAVAPRAQVYSRSNTLASEKSQLSDHSLSL